MSAEIEERIGETPILRFSPDYYKGKATLLEGLTLYVY
jgi:hypothetical protein